MNEKNRDEGVMLIEVLVTMLVVSVVLIPLTALILSVMSQTQTMTQRAQQASILVSVPALVQSASVDPCVDPDGFRVELQSRLRLDVDWRVEVRTYCEDVPPLVEVEVVTPKGHVEAVLSLVSQL